MSDLIHFDGKMSTFGGPDDEGVEPSEGLSLVEPRDLTNPHCRDLFLTTQPPGTTGLARRLDPTKAYCAARWDLQVTPRSLLREIQVTISNPANGRQMSATPVDTGPAERTGRVMDLSPGVAEQLGLDTDDEAVMTFSQEAAPR